MSYRRRRNAINMVNVYGVSVEGVQQIRSAVFAHFSSHFKSLRIDRPSVEGLHFQKLSFRKGGQLTKPFSLEEVKQAVWDYDSYKSPGPDGIILDSSKTSRT